MSVSPGTDLVLDLCPKCRAIFMVPLCQLSSKSMSASKISDRSMLGRQRMLKPYLEVPYLQPFEELCLG